MRTKVKLVDGEEAAIQAIRQFRLEGHSLNEIYVLAHDGDTAQELSRLTDTKTIGMMEEGMATAFANLFRSRGDQLRAKMESLGISALDAERYESELDRGKIIVLVWYDEDTGTLDRADEAARRRPRPEELLLPPVGGAVMSERR
ncbi:MULTISPECIES: general stress protein [Paenibacillus]|uniref:general stress protein n=1 Tax=Paenibacillus TaxID=44249 RepID=UPI0022B8C968|nr:general stress protein [Paenibacillus caseinilyticus]MCZ8519675.1 general stress protein [Paenibacillus caseinilyticus]